jgi:MFS transporter, MHS family, shikimate and dehydroshikimate transport protein
MFPTGTAHKPLPASESLNTKHMRRILASSLIGSAIEFYDFVLYATAAAIVFGQLFFTDLAPGVAVFASFGTLAAGYIARPLGGIVFGHFGDRYGRKAALVTSMLIMGLATTAIGLLPGTAQIGVAAPLLLIVLRIVQGAAIGGEWGGAMLMGLEHAPEKKRGFAASFANMGAPLGVLMATLAFSAVTLLPEPEFMAWGWRIPFLLSIVLVVIGLIIRVKVSESPIFKELEHKATAKKVPVLEVLTKHPKNLTLGLVAGISVYTIGAMITVWGLSFAIEAGADKTGALNAKAVAAFAGLLTTFWSARLSDIYGRKPILLIGVASAVLSAFPILWMTGTGTVAGYAGAVILGQLVQGMIFGPFGAYTAELFPTRIRYTGASMTYQGASALGAGFTPAIASGLLLLSGGNLLPLGLVWIGALAASGIAIFLSREGRNQNLRNI